MQSSDGGVLVILFVNTYHNLHKLEVAIGQEVRANIWVHLGVAIDETRFHNCVGKSEKALSQKESLQIMKTGLNDIVDKTYI